MSTTPLHTHEKALVINLDQTIFGSFAEIGAGQEVARWFLQVGAASGTVAKTVSAYDKEVSDDLYGAGTRYVSLQRLEAMLDREWHQLLAQLQDSRGSSTCFFSFADTISARNFAGTNECHGWMGIRFQTQPGGAVQDVVLHLNLHDTSNLSQQEAVGIIGVNLIYAVFHQGQDKQSLLRALLDQASLQRVEIDFIQVRGPAFENWNSQELLVSLVLEGLAEAIILPTGGLSGPPSELLRKRPIVLAPFTLDHPHPMHREILTAALSKLKEEAGGDSREPLGILAVSVAPTNPSQATPQRLDVSRGVEALQALGTDVLVSSRTELYRMTSFVNRYTQAPLRFAVELPALVHIFSQAHGPLEGRLLEGVARLFAQNVAVYAFPVTSSVLQEALSVESAADWRWETENGWISVNQLHPPPPLGHLFDYLLASNFIVPVARSS